MIAADTNLVAYLLIQGPQTRRAREVYAKDGEWLLPPLWRAEFLNVLITSVRCGVIDAKQATGVWRSACSLFGALEREPVGEVVLSTALRHGLTAYDAQFIAVAEAEGVPLVTADRKVLAACPGIAVSADAFVRKRA